MLHNFLSFAFAVSLHNIGKTAHSLNNPPLNVLLFLEKHVETKYLFQQFSENRPNTEIFMISFQVFYIKRNSLQLPDRFSLWHCCSVTTMQGAVQMQLETSNKSEAALSQLGCSTVSKVNLNRVGGLPVSQLVPFSGKCDCTLRMRIIPDVVPILVYLSSRL